MDNFSLEMEAYDIRLGILTSALVRVFDTETFKENINILKNGINFLNNMKSGGEFIYNINTEFTPSNINEIQVYNFIINNYDKIFEDEITPENTVVFISDCTCTLDKAINNPESILPDEKKKTRMFFNRLSDTITHSNAEKYCSLKIDF